MDYVKNFEKAIEDFRAESDKLKSMNSLVNKLQCLVDAIKHQNTSIQDIVGDIEKYDNSVVCVQKALDAVRLQIKLETEDNSKALDSAVGNLERAAGELAKKAVQDGCINEIKECLGEVGQLSSVMESQVVEFRNLIVLNEKERTRAVEEQIKQFREIVSEDRDNRAETINIIKEYNGNLCNKVCESVGNVVQSLSAEKLHQDMNDIHEVSLRIDSLVKELQDVLVERKADGYTAVIEQVDRLQQIVRDDEKDRAKTIELIREENERSCEKMLGVLCKEISSIHREINAIHREISEVKQVIYDDKNSRAEFLSQVQKTVNIVYEQGHKTTDNIKSQLKKFLR